MIKSMSHRISQDKEEKRVEGKGRSSTGRKSWVGRRGRKTMVDVD
jgi:hypothetical protein